MSDSITNSSAKLIPGLFNLAARADDPETVLEIRNALASGRRPAAERMLDARRLEAVLDAVTRRKKGTARTGPEKPVTLGDTE